MSLQALLNKRAACALVSLFCLVECVWSWASITKGVRHREDLINTLIFAFVILSPFQSHIGLPSGQIG